MAEKIESRIEPSPRLPVKIIITKEDGNEKLDDSMDIGTDVDASFQSAFEDFENDTVRDVSLDEEILKDIATDSGTQKQPAKDKTVTEQDEEELKKLDRSHSSSSSLEDVIAVSLTFVFYPFPK